MKINKKTHKHKQHRFPRFAFCLYLFGICGSQVILQNLTVSAELQYLKAGFVFALDLVAEFKMFFGTTVFDVNVINSYCILRSSTASRSFTMLAAGYTSFAQKAG